MQMDLLSQERKKIERGINTTWMCLQILGDLWLSCNSLLYMVASSVPVTEMILQFQLCHQYKVVVPCNSFPSMATFLCVCVLSSFWLFQLPPRAEGTLLGGTEGPCPSPTLLPMMLRGPRQDGRAPCRGSVSATGDLAQPSTSAWSHSGTYQAQHV